MGTTNRLAAISAVLLTALLSLCSVGVLRADNPVWVEYPNEYIRASLGVSGSFDGTNGEEWFCAGRWAVVTEEGDPDTDADDNKELIYFGSTAPAHNFGYWTIKVGTQTYVIGDSNTGAWYENLQTGAYGAPRVYAYPGAANGQWDSRTGGFIRATWRVTLADTESPEYIDVTIEISHVRDQARFEITLKNSSGVPQSVGLSMKGDVEVGSSVSTGAPFVPGIGYVESDVYKDQFIATLFGAPNTPAVPDYFDIFDNLGNPTLVSRNILNQQDCVKPDYVAIGDYGDLAGYDVWLADETYVPDQMYPVTDFYWALCWDQKPLSSGKTRKIVTYYGVGAATSKWTYQMGHTTQRDSAVLAVQAPRSLVYNSTNVGQNTISPATFSIKAYVHNLNVGAGPYDLEDVWATLFLPEGLQLTPGETASKNIGPVLSHTEAAPVEWEVTANGRQPGALAYSVTAFDTGGLNWQQTVTRQIIVPADKQRVFEWDWQLVSVPFEFNNPLIDHAFGIELGFFGAKWWDPLRSPDADRSYYPATEVEPGKAFWMAVSDIDQYGDTASFDLASDAHIVGQKLGKQVYEQHVDVYPGWNMIGNPFVYPVYWGQVLVCDTSGQVPITYTLDEAARKKWVSKILFDWNPKTREYDNVMTNDGFLVPFKGYWLYARRAVTLVFRPSIFPESDVITYNGY